MKRVHFDDLHEDQLATFEGVPFTGIAFAESDEQRLTDEVEFRNGLQDGVARDWYANGQLRSEGRFRKGARHGPYAEWYETGAPKRQANYELGVLLKETAWDQAGAVERQYAIDPASSTYRILELLRAGQSQ